MRCAECGALVAVATRACAGCGAPPAGKRSVAADPVAAGPGHDQEMVPAAARDAWRPPAWLRRSRRHFMMSLVFFLVLYVMGVVVLNYTSQPSELHHAIHWAIVVPILGALLSLVLFEAARNQFHYRQILWALVPVLSIGLLAFVPFLWLALVRRRARDWAVFAAYLAVAVPNSH
jgi:hypothetical protein